MNKKQLALFKLSLIHEIGYIRLSKLMEIFGDPETILSASISDLTNIENIGPKSAQAINETAKSDFALREIEKAQKNNIDIVLYNDEKYPIALRDYPDKPLVLYIKGNIIEKDFDSLSIVGSRAISNYGKIVTREFASFFSKRGITIISGLARGVDSLAHTAAIENKSRTIAVLGNGLLIKYPPENAALQNKISDNGAVISEYALTQPPSKITFPRRNRIISGLSRAVLITEAAQSSGALISARYAAEYGKEVFAVPGNIYSKYSQGTNFLIQMGAHPALCPQDIAESLWLNLIAKKSDDENKESSLTLEPNEKQILKIIEESLEGITIEIIVEKTQMDISALSQILLNLELNDFIAALPGNIYIRKK